MTDSSSLAIYGLFDASLQLSGERIGKNLDALLSGQTAQPTGKVTVNVMVEEDTTGYIEIIYDQHIVRLIAIAAPLPESELQYPLQSAHLRQDQKDLIQQHKTHMILSYAGNATEMTEKFIALYLVAAACAPLGLVGVVNPFTWMCLVTPMLLDTVKPNFREEFRRSPAALLMLWLGLVKFFTPAQKVWFATRGATLFGVPDFAYKGDLKDADTAIDMFSTLITHVYQSKAHFAVGHTIQLPGNVYLRFGRLTEYTEFMGADTLVLERIKPSDINR